MHLWKKSDHPKTTSTLFLQGGFMIGLSYDELKLGDSAYFEKTISESDVYLFAGITGDLNPAHINEVAAQKTRFGGRIAHGMLVSSLISAVLGMQLPGPGTIYLSQNLKFLAPVMIGDTIKAQVEVIHLDDLKKRVTLKTQCLKNDGTLVVDGEAIVLAPKK
jgi:3-hydroxybutyryl-CoA dehydratase